MKTARLKINKFGRRFYEIDGRLYEQQRRDLVKDETTTVTVVILARGKRGGLKILHEHGNGVIEDVTNKAMSVSWIVSISSRELTDPASSNNSQSFQNRIDAMHYFWKLVRNSENTGSCIELWRVKRFWDNGYKIDNKLIWRFIDEWLNTYARP